MRALEKSKLVTERRNKMDDINQPVYDNSQLAPEQVSPYLLPNELVSPEQVMPAPQPQMVIPAGGANVNLAPQPVQAPIPIPAQYSKPAPVLKQAAAPAIAPEEKAIIDSYNPQLKAAKAITQAAADSAVLKESAVAEQEHQMAQQQVKSQQIQQQFDTAFNQRVTYLDDVSKQLASQDFSSAKVDSNRLFSNLGTGQKILAGIAIALGGYGGALSGKGDNRALDIINKAIDRDIEEQKINIQQDADVKRSKAQNLRDQTGNGQSMLSNLRAKFSDDLSAETSLRLLYNQQIQAKLAKIAAGTESKVVQANLANVIAPLQREQAQLSMQLKAQVAQQKMLESIGGGENLSPVQEALLPKDVREAVVSQRERSVPGFHGAAPNKEVANKFTEYVKETQPAIDAVKKILAATKNFPVDPVKRAEIATDLKILAGKLRLPLQGPGAMTDNDYARLMDTLGNPNAFASLSSVERAKLNRVQQNLEDSMEANATASGFRRVPTINKAKLRPY